MQNWQTTSELWSKTELYFSEEGWGDGRERRGRWGGEEVVRRGEALLVVRVCEVPDCTHVFMFLNVPRMYVLGQCGTLWGEHERSSNM